jgi:hypothetical protein
MSGNFKTFRHEIKYYINFFEYHNLRLRLNKVLRHDKYGDVDGNYHIRSLYFDDIKSSALFEKQSGVLTRKKYRIRIYNLNDDVIKLERKNRIGQFINKESVSITREEYNKIISNDIDFLYESKKPLLVQFYFEIKENLVKQDVIVDYTREAYVSDISNIRITLDKDLRTGLTNTDLFNKSAPSIKALDEPWMILEVKFNNFLPDYIKNIIQLASNQRYAISKFVICKKMIKLNNWEDN